MDWIAGLVAAMVSVVVGFAVVRLGPALGFVDLPDGNLKTHQGSPVPLGGVALFGGAHAGLAVAGLFDTSLLVGSGLLLVLGAVDDRRPLSPSIRLAVTVAAGVIVAAGVESLEGPWQIAVGALAVVVAVNAVNLFDGLDALASSVGGLGLVGLAVFGAVVGTADAWAPAVVALALIGVLVFNWPPARLYLGDNGAYVLGAFLAWSALRSAGGWALGLLAFGLIGVPLLDLAVTVLRRLRAGLPLFEGDRDHVYDRLMARWRSPLRVVAAMWLAQAGFVLFGVLVADRLSPWPALTAYGALALAVVLLALVRKQRPSPAEKG